MRLNNIFFSLEFDKDLKKQYFENYLFKHLFLKLNKLIDSKLYNNIVVKIKKIDRKNKHKVDINFVTKTTNTITREFCRSSK